MFFSLSVYNSLSFIFSSFFSFPSLHFKATDHVSAPHWLLFHIMCQNRPHTLISTRHIFFLFSSIPLTLFLLSLYSVFSVWFRCAKFLHDCPEAFSSHEWQMQTALLRWVAHLLTDFPVVSLFEPQSGLCFESRSCFSNWSCARQLMFTQTINRNYVAPYLTKCRCGRHYFCSVLFWQVKSQAVVKSSFSWINK